MRADHMPERRRLSGERVLITPDDRCPCGQPQEGSGYCSYACFSRYEMGAPIETPRPPASEPASGPGAPGPHTDRGTGVQGPHARAETTVDTIARILVGTDWDNGTPYTDIGPREAVEYKAERIAAALRVVHDRDAAQRLRDEATTRAASAPDAVAYHRACGINDAAVLLESITDDLTEGTTQ